MGRESKKGKEVEEPKKPVHMLAKEKHESFMSKLGHDVKKMTLTQQIGAINMAIEKVAKSHKRESCKSRIERMQQEENEYQEKLRQHRLSISPFKCTLNKAQMVILLLFFNEHLLETPITLEGLDCFFMGKGSKSVYRLKDEKLFYLLFKGLSGEGYKFFNKNSTDERTLFISYFEIMEGHKYISGFWANKIKELEKEGIIELRNEENYTITDKRISQSLTRIRESFEKQKERLEKLKCLFRVLVELEVCKENLLIDNNL